MQPEIKFSIDNIDPRFFFRLIIGGDFSSLSSKGFVAREGLKPIPIKVPMKWKHKDSNIEFNLHAWRFFSASWAFYVKQSSFEIAKEVFEFNIKVIKDWDRHGIKDKSKYAWYDMTAGIRAMHLAFMKYVILKHCLNVHEEDKLLIDKLSALHITWLSTQKNITLNP